MQWKTEDNINHWLTRNDTVLIVRKTYGQGIVVIRLPGGKEVKFAHPDDDVTIPQLQEFAIAKMDEYLKKTVWTDVEKEAVERLKKSAAMHSKQQPFTNPFGDLFGDMFGGFPHGRK